MNAKIWLVAASFASFAIAGTATAAVTAPGMEKEGMLVDAKGMTLYTYDKDSIGKSACSGKCAENWPPLMAQEGSAASGEWTVFKRDDGAMQWAYGGHPLYTYVMDKLVGDKTGDGKGGTWKIAKP
jgi:predicted lipoprotein with Yx(FWY)xxD motif